MQRVIIKPRDPNAPIGNRMEYRSSNSSSGINNSNSTPSRTIPLQNKLQQHNVSRRYDASIAPIRNKKIMVQRETAADSSVANYQHDDLANHYYTPPRRKQQSQQQHPNSQYHQRSKKSKPSLLSRASKQLKQKIIKEETNHDYDFYSEDNCSDKEDTYIREARDPSPTNEAKYSFLLNNTDIYHDNGLKKVGLPQDRRRGTTAYQGIYPSLEELDVDSTTTTVYTKDSVTSHDAMSPITEADYQGVSEQESGRSVQLRDADIQWYLQQQEVMGKYLSSKDEAIKQLHREKEEMENETTKLREELRQQKQKLEAMEGKANTKINEYATQVERDLEAYKRKCSEYREKLLLKERENGKVEKALYNERKKVLSLESENEMLINIAEERVGNALNLEKAKSSELKSYIEQCENYRDRVLGLESKVMSMEDALNATSSIAAAVEEEKKALLAELNQAKANEVTFKSEISGKDAEISSLRSDVSSLESKCSKLEATLKSVKSKGSDDKQSIVMLEGENASLLEQLKEKSLVVEKLQASADHCKQIEDENASLKRKNDELTAKALDLKEELSKSEVFSSNTERLRKMLADSESFISALQTDLSSSRTNHHQQLTEVRAKYSSEIDGLTTQLERQTIAKRELETKNNDLEVKVLSLERKMSELDEKGIHQEKTQSDKMLKMMEHADDLRKQLSESSREVSEMKRELDSYERTVAELRSKIKALEGDKSLISALQTDLSSTQTTHYQQLLNLRTRYSSEIDELTNQLEKQITANRELETKNHDLEDKVFTLERKMSEIEEKGVPQTKAQSDELLKIMEHADDLRKKLSESSQEVSVKKLELDNNERLMSHLRSKIKALEGDKSVISALQADLSSARINHEQQLKEVRAKYSYEIDELITKLESAKTAKRELETKNNDLADKILLFDRAKFEHEDNGLQQAKAQSEQLLSDLRKQLSQSTQDVSELKRELRSNERIVTQLRNKIQTLEGAKSAMSDNVKALQRELRNFTTEKTNKIKELQKHIKDRDDAVAKLTTPDATTKLQQIEGLKYVKNKLKDAEEENDMLSDQLLRKQASDMKQHFSDTINDLKVEQKTLKSDLQSSLLSEKALLEKKVKEMALDCRRKLECDYLNKAMLHQASMSSLHSQMKDVEKLLSDERTKTQQIESTLEEARRKKEALEATIQAACSKLGRETRENDLVDAINDLMIEGSQADSKIITLNIDIKTLNSTISSLEYDKEQLSRQMRALSERTEKEINELKRVYTEDRRAQDASIESMIASKEEKLQSMRTANDGMKGQIERLTVEAAHLQKLKESCEAELKECQEELSAAKEECESLKNKLSEATRNNLAEHYMQIEDEIRIQLNTARREKDATEKKLAAKNKETDRMMDDFYRQKQELTSRTMELTDKLDEMSNERDILQRQEELLKSTIAAKERETKELEKCVTNLKDQLECAQNEAKKYEEKAEKAEQQSLQNAILPKQSSRVTKSHLKQIVVDVGTEMENENFVASLNRGKKEEMKKKTISFFCHQHQESPRVAKAKENAAFALGSPRAPLTPRTPRTPQTTLQTFNNWVLPKTPRALATTARSTVRYSYSNETGETEEMWEPQSAASYYLT